MSILLTGGTGYIGSHVAAHLMASGQKVVLLDNLCNSNTNVVDALEKIAGTPPEFVQADIRDTETVRNALSTHGVQAVIHLAGLKAVGESVAHPLMYYDNNVIGTLSLLQAMQKTGVTRIVFSSSATVYGAPVYLPLDENHRTAPENPYGQTKLQIEQILSDLCTSDPEFTAIVLRYFNPVGAHDSGLIGENPNGIPNNLMPYVARVATGQLPDIQVFGDDYDTPDGTGVRDYIHINDLAEGHGMALSKTAEMTGWHAVNLGTGAGVSVLEMITAFEAACGNPLPRRIAPRRAGDVPAFWADPSKAETFMGWRATRSLQHMCDSVWAFSQKLNR